MRAREMGRHINGLPLALAFPASVKYTRPSALWVEGTDYVFPLHMREKLEEQFSQYTLVEIREEYEVAKRGRY